MPILGILLRLLARTQSFCLFSSRWDTVLFHWLWNSCHSSGFTHSLWQVLLASSKPEPGMIKGSFHFPAVKCIIMDTGKLGGFSRVISWGLRPYNKHFLWFKTVMSFASDCCMLHNAGSSHSHQPCTPPCLLLITAPLFFPPLIPGFLSTKKQVAKLCR